MQNNQHPRDYYDHEELFDDGGWDGQPNRLVSYPSSVQDAQRQALNSAWEAQQQAQQQAQLASQRQALASMQAGLQALAQNHGDLMTLLLAAPFGKREITFEHRDTTVETTETVHYRMGVAVGKDVQTKTTARVVQRRHTLD